MKTFSVHTTSPTRFCGSVYEAYHAEDYARDGRNRAKERMKILIQSACEVKVEKNDPDPDKR
jgi:hypothetical protein